MFTVPLDYVMPNSLLPRFGDDVNTSVGSVAHSLEFAYRAYSEPAMVAYLPKSMTWDSIQLGRSIDERPAVPASRSKLFPSAGHAIARTDGAKGLVSVMTFGPYGGFHGHFDKLSFVFYAYGKEMGVDPGRARSQAYRLPIHRNWYKATIAHNTVVVDGKSQAPATGRLLQFDAGQDRTLVVAQCAEAYDDVIHTRLLLLTADYLLVFDDLNADDEHRFDWLYHNRGELTEQTVARKPIEDAADGFTGTEYIENARVGATDSAVQVTFATEDVANVLTLDASANTEIMVGDGVGASVLDRVPLIRVTRRGKTARFAAVLEPLSWDASPTVSSVSWHKRPPGIRIEVMRGNRCDSIEAGANWKNVTWMPK
jgi:hypothetical protein